MTAWWPNSSVSKAAARGEHPSIIIRYEHMHTGAFKDASQHWTLEGQPQVLSLSDILLRHTPAAHVLMETSHSLST